MRRETVGSGTTGPNTADSAHSIPIDAVFLMSARMDKGSLSPARSAGTWSVPRVVTKGTPAMASAPGAASGALARRSGGDEPVVEHDLVAALDPVGDDLEPLVLGQVAALPRGAVPGAEP